MLHGLEDMEDKVERFKIPQADGHKDHTWSLKYFSSRPEFGPRSWGCLTNWCGAERWPWPGQMLSNGDQHDEPQLRGAAGGGISSSRRNRQNREKHEENNRNKELGGLYCRTMKGPDAGLHRLFIDLDQALHASTCTRRLQVMFNHLPFITRLHKWPFSAERLLCSCSLRKEIYYVELKFIKFD